MTARTGSPNGSPMSVFAYRNGVLHAESVSLEDVAREVGTPFYLYSTAALESHYNAYAGAFAGQDAGVCYALKANSNLAVIRTLAKLGAGGDVVSVGEMKRALAGGIPAERIVFSGVGKTRDDLRAALEAGIHQINVESVPELEALSEVAASLGVEAPIAFRVNPDVDAKTHAKIATGKKENKFGIDYDHAREIYRRAAALPGIKPVAIAVHIGSQLTDLAPSGRLTSGSRPCCTSCARTATTSSAWTSAAVSASPTRTRRRPIWPTMPRWCARSPAISAAASRWSRAARWSATPASWSAASSM